MGLDMMFSAKREEGTVEAGYLRKANQIHGWIDRQVDGGVENCEPVDLTREQVQELLDAINLVLEYSVLVDDKVAVGYSFENGQQAPILEAGQVIANPSIAQEHLPTTSGFFFGSLDYDQFYIEDLKSAKKIVEDFLADERNLVLVYEPWW